jgi:hypothetical protein
MQEEKIERTFQEEANGFEVKVEGLSDGYRFTIRGEEAEVQKHRRVGASFIQFAKQAQKAGWRLPWFIRLLIAFWSKYK